MKIINPLKSFFGLIFVSLILLACNPIIWQGEKLSMNPQTINSFWNSENVVISQDTIMLVSKNAKLVSRFKTKNFSLSVDLITSGGAEGFLNFHTDIKAGSNAGSKTKGYSVIINNSDYRAGNPEKTGSLSLIRNNFVRMANDDKLFNLKIDVKNNVIRVMIDGKVISEYIQPEYPVRISELNDRVLSDGYLVLQKSNDAGMILVENMELEAYADEFEFSEDTSFVNDSIGEILTRLNQQGFPVIDYHAHLKGGLTVDQIGKHGRSNGYNYGIAPNCGLNFPVTNDSSLIAFYNEMVSEPVFKAMQCEGREWITLFSPEAIALYDYIFTDAMTWTDHKGRRMRLWIPEETFVDDEQQFMDMLVSKIEAELSQEPVDIFVNPTYLPDVIAAQYDELWTPERMDRVIKTLVKNDVALEINSRFKIPSISFVKRAKAAGVKFTLGTNNAGNTDLGRLDYGLKVIEEAGITFEDMFLPRPSGEKKVLKMGLPLKITG
jgi:hypothetical protein